jgi:hypothetical protein
MIIHITVLEADPEAYKSDPPTPSRLPHRFCACYDPFWKPEIFGKKYSLKAFGNSREEAIESLKGQITEVMKRERILTIQDVELEI